MIIYDMIKRMSTHIIHSYLFAGEREGNVADASFIRKLKQPN